jgi:peptidoglycan/xylan/chitin deacetylase (PgdA/CDA1 family)
MNTFRLDRAVSVGLVHPVLRVLGRKARASIPILMYHGIRDGVGKKHPYFETNTSPKVFENHMQFLRDQGFVVVHLGEAIEAIRRDENGARHVVITFDDGYRDFYTDAFPVLAKYGLKATMFIVSGRTGNEPIRQDNCEFMTWAEVREVRRYGIEIGSHTVNHPELYRMTESQVEDELVLSKRVIEDNVGASVRSFAYPFAFPEQDEKFTAGLRNLLERSGYESGVSTIVGMAGHEHNRFILPRVPVNEHDDLRLYRAKLEGAYDWLHTAQFIYKAAKKFRAGNRGARIYASESVTSLFPPF